MRMSQFTTVNSSSRKQPRSPPQNQARKTIVSEIEKLNKNAMVKSIHIETKDYPEKSVPFLLALIPILFILDWRIKI